MYKAINVSEIHFAGRSFSVQLLASDESYRETQENIKTSGKLLSHEQLLIYEGSCLVYSK